MKRPTILTILIIFAFAYALWPRDVVPDAFGLLGRVDDVLVILYVYHRYSTWKKKEAARVKQAEQAKKAEPPPKTTAQATFDPYEVLGIPSHANQEEIRTAYKRLANQYHPDRVAHLGPDLQELAHEKMLSIQRAYEQLST